MYSNLQEISSNTDKKKKHVERNWFSDLMLLQIESIPAGHNEVTVMFKHLAQKNNASLSPQLTKTPSPQLKAFSLLHICPQLKVESMNTHTRNNALQSTVGAQKL